jgi:hypothetical protein
MYNYYVTSLLHVKVALKLVVDVLCYIVKVLNEII